MRLKKSDYGWDSVKSNSGGIYKPLAAGAYVCKIVKATFERVPEKGLSMTLDIDVAEGDYTDYFVKRQRGGKWDFDAQFKRYVIKSDRLFTPAYKTLIELLEQQNPSFQDDPDTFDTDVLEEKMRGLICGFTFARRYYHGRDSKIYESAKIKFPCLAEDVRAGKVETPPDEQPPEEKKTDEVSREELDNVLNDDDFPF